MKVGRLKEKINFRDQPIFAQIWSKMTKFLAKQSQFLSLQEFPYKLFTNYYWGCNHIIDGIYPPSL